MNRLRIGEVAQILLDYAERRETFQTERIMSVAADSYTDLDRWRAEMNLIFKRVPLMLALSCEMPKPGDYKAMDVIGSPILIARDRVGTVRAFLNVCAHRWSPVAAEGYGNCARFRFTCQFHGWTYAADGKLIAITDQSKFGEIDYSTHGLKELPCQERHGMIFTCLTPGMPLDLDAYFGALLEEYAYFGIQDWALLGTRVIEGANWKLTFNNFLESYHFASLHAKTVAVHALPDVNHFEGFGPNIRTSVVQRSIAQLRQVPREKWGEREGWEFAFIRVFFPNVTGNISYEPEISVFTQTYPGSTPDKCRIVLLFLRKDPPKDQAERDAIEEKINRATSDIARDEDNAICLQIQKALESRAHGGLLYGRNERANQYFQEWLDWYLREDAASPKPEI